MINLILITFVCCFFVQSGAAEAIKHLVWRVLKGRGVPYRDFRLKPIDCELCLTWWSCICYLLWSGLFSLKWIAVAAVLAWMTPLVVDVLHLIVDIPRWLIDKIRQYM